MKQPPTEVWKFTLLEQHHAYLFTRYSSRSGLFEQVGDFTGPYGQEDRATGAVYKCLGEETTVKNKRGIYCSSDLGPGAFYPPTLFIYGCRDSEDDPLPFEVVEEFVTKFWGTTTTRAFLPWGWDPKKGFTWHQAVYYRPDNRPQWHGLIDRARNIFPDAQIDPYPKAHSFSVTFEVPVYSMNDKIKKLAERLGEIMLDEKLPLDIVQCETGEIIIPANRKITKTLLKKVASIHDSIDIDPSPIRNRIQQVIQQWRTDLQIP